MEAPAQQILSLLWIPANHPCTSRCLTLSTKQPLRAAVPGEVDSPASFMLRIDWSQDLQTIHSGKLLLVVIFLTDTCTGHCGAGNEPPALQGRGSDTGGESWLRCLWNKQEGSPGDSDLCRRASAARDFTNGIKALEWFGWEGPWDTFRGLAPSPTHGVRQ